MNRLLLFILAILTLGLASCVSDLKEEDYLFSYFFTDRGEKSIVMDSITLVKYDIHPITHDTSLVTFLVSYRLSDKVFDNNDIFTPKFNITAELYVNEIEHQISLEPLTRKIYMNKGFRLFKDKENKMYFKYILWDRNQERVVCSDTLKFRVN